LLDLEFDNCETVEIQPKESNYIDEHNYFYFGTIKPPSDSCQCSCSSGELMIQSRGGRKFGFILIDTTKYEILAVDDSYSVLGKLDPIIFDSTSECKNNITQAINLDGQLNKKISKRTAGCPIRVLFLYDQDAENSYGLNGIIDLVNTAVNTTNLAFSNSDIKNTRVDIANIRKISGFVERKEYIEYDLRILMLDTIISQQRDTDLADVVCIIGSDNYTRFNGYSGYKPDTAHPGQTINNLGNPQADLAYMIIKAGNINSTYTFSHELGHIIGCRHQTCDQEPSSCDSTGSYEHGSGWGDRKCFLCSWKNYCTIMHTLNDQTRVLYYSNPNVSYFGHPTGVMDTRDNAKWIREDHACIVSNYKSEPTSLTVSISGEDILCRPLSSHYYADVIGYNAPYSYQWSLSTDGVNFSSIVGTGQSITIDSTDYALSPILFLRVRVEDSLGNFNFAFYRILIRDRGEPGCDFHPSLTNGIFENDVKIYPNPVENELRAKFSIFQTDVSVTIEMDDLIGRSILNKKLILSKGTYIENLNVENIPKGIYPIQVKIGKDVIFYKIIKCN